MNGFYSHNKNQIAGHLECLDQNLDEYSKGYENFDFIKHFSVSLNDDSMKQRCDFNDLRRLIKKPTCIDLILTNSVFGKGLSNFRLLTVTEFRVILQEHNPSIIYCDYEKFGNTTLHTCQIFSKKYILLYYSNYY